MAYQQPLQGNFEQGFPNQEYYYAQGPPQGYSYSQEAPAYRPTNQYESLADLIDTADSYSFEQSPSSTIADDSASVGGYFYGQNNCTSGDSFVSYTDSGTVCAQADSSSTTPPSSDHKPRKRKSPEVQARQRRAANERERKRMNNINYGFDSLRTRIPTLPYEKRLSKVDTLRLAIGYINILKDLLQQDDEQRAAGADADGKSSQNVDGDTGKVIGTRSHLGPPPAKKIVINCHSGELPVSGHSLSWKSDGNNCGNTLSAKLWMPETQSQPNTPINQIQTSSSS